MPRSGRISKRQPVPDPLYNSRVVAKLINGVMKDGKKTIAQNLVYKAFDKIQKDSGKNPLTVFETALANVQPRMEVKPRRVGGASYMVPIEVRGDRREALAIRWLLDAARSRPNSQFHTFDAKLSAELVDASEGRGLALKKREDVQKAAEANRAFAHFRWG